MIFIKYITPKLLLCAFIIMFSNNMSGQVYTIQGSGTSGNSPQYSPYTNNYANSRNQFIISAAELRGLGAPAGGIISSIGFRGNVNGGSCTFNFIIQIGHTSLNQFGAPALTTAGGWESGLSAFYSNGSLNSNNIAGWKDYNGSFCWNGTSNVLIQICKISGCSAPTAPTVYYHSSKASPCGQTGRYAYGNGGSGSTCSWIPSGALPQGQGIFRPDMRFTINATGPCPANGAAITGTANLCQTLPVELVSFNASITENKQVKLDWYTASETRSDFFTIERSQDGYTFEPIKTVKAAGNSTNLRKYTTTDEQPLQGISYYRLSQTDINDEVKQSEVIFVDMNEEPSVALDNLHPNPTSNKLDFDFYTPLKGNVHIQVMDYTGRIVQDETLQVDAGYSLLNTTLESLPQGMYSLIVDFDKTGFRSVNKVIKN